MVDTKKTDLFTFGKSHENTECEGGGRDFSKRFSEYWFAIVVITGFGWPADSESERKTATTVATISRSHIHIRKMMTKTCDDVHNVTEVTACRGLS